MNPNRTEIKNKLNTFINRGGIVLATKTRAAIYGGKTNISLGRFQSAVPSNKRYAVFTTGRRVEAHRDLYFTTAWEAVNWFVDFCGNEIAWDAYRQASR
jgi:hypothetical protein